ncbi:MAG TPA: hypothetical protein VF820_00075 [Patescibacteria group bacterium]
MKKILIAIVVVVIIIAAYLGRHSLKAMFVSSQPAVTTTAAPTTTQSATQAASPSDNIYLTKTNPTKGQYLTDFAGMTLYIFDKDSKDTSNCSGSCATNWPPYTSGAVAQKTFPANIGVITRADGTKQFTYNGMPLYYYAGDKSSGDTNGDGVGGIWHLVKP